MTSNTFSRRAAICLRCPARLTDWSNTQQTTVGWRSSDAAIKTFSDIVFAAGYASPVRTPRGEDIMAACGQLKSDSVKLRRSERLPA
jgi:adenine C2-methylase RlmN of 23S rRNA A2503 and tRNA A37